MAVQNQNTLKGWFVTLAKPLQNQFWDWIDSFRHKNDKIVFDDLHPDVQALFNSIQPSTVKQRLVVSDDTSFLMIKEYELVGLWIQNKSDHPMTLAVNYDPGAVEAWREVTLESGKFEDLKLFKTMDVDTTYFITGITGDVIILIDRKQ